MNSKQSSNNENAHIDSIRGTIAKPEILKSGRIKLLVISLCVVSFIAGWMASRSHYAKECFEAGGQITKQNSVIICKF